MIPASATMACYLVAGGLMLLGLNPPFGDDRTKTSTWLVLAGVALAMLTSLAWVADASALRILAVLGVAGMGAVAGAIGVLRAGNRKGELLIPLVLAGAGAAAVLTSAAVFMAPLGLTQMAGAALKSPQLLALNVSVACGGFAMAVALTVCGRVIGLLDPAMVPAMSRNSAILIVAATLLLGMMLFAFDQPATLFWFSLSAGLCAGVLRSASVRSQRLGAMTHLALSSAGWAMAASGIMLSNLGLIIAGGLLGAAGAVLLAAGDQTNTGGTA